MAYSYLKLESDTAKTMGLHGRTVSINLELDILGDNPRIKATAYFLAENDLEHRVSDAETITINGKDYRLFDLVLHATIEPHYQGAYMSTTGWSQPLTDSARKKSQPLAQELLEHLNSDIAGLVLAWRNEETERLERAYSYVLERAADDRAYGQRKRDEATAKALAGFGVGA